MSQGVGASQSLVCPTMRLVVGVVVAALLGSVGVLASIIPAYRATLVDPVRTLRDE